MANNIRELQIGMAMKQEEMVRRVNLPGFDVPLLSKIENDRCRPTPEQESAIYRVLQAQPVELYGEWKEADIKIPKATKTQIERKKEDAPFDVLDLVSCLGSGKRNAVRIGVLTAKLDLNNRDLRRLIAKAYSYGYYIANDQDGAGYYLIDTVEEASRYYRQERARTMALLEKKMAPLERWIYLNGGQI